MNNCERVEIDTIKDTVCQSATIMSRGKLPTSCEVTEEILISIYNKKAEKNSEIRIYNLMNFKKNIENEFKELSKNMSEGIKKVRKDIENTKDNKVITKLKDELVILAKAQDELYNNLTLMMYEYTEQKQYKKYEIARITAGGLIIWL